MPKRRRMLTPSKKPKLTVRDEPDDEDVVSSARGRLKGALTDALESYGEDPYPQKTPVKLENHEEQSEGGSSEEDEDDWSPTSSYVLKLFDRSVDLSQFKEDSPLYPICRAWMLNQPKVNYKRYGKKSIKEEISKEGIELPKPETPPVSRIPSLIPEQQARDKNNINLDYSEAPPPSVEELLNFHLRRWSSVRHAWVKQAAKAEARYSASQDILNQMYSAI